jgi:hypothetical protein
VQIGNIRTEKHHNVIKIGDKLNFQARLHMPPNVKGWRCCIETLDNWRHVGHHGVARTKRHLKQVDTPIASKDKRCKKDTGRQA